MLCGCLLSWRKNKINTVWEIKMICWKDSTTKKTGFWCKVFCPGNEQDGWQSEGDQKHDRPEGSPGAHQDQVYRAATGATTKWQSGGPVRLWWELPLSVFVVVAFLSRTLWGHTVYAVAHWQKHSRGLEDCVCNCLFFVSNIFLPLPHGQPHPLWKIYLPFLEGGCC